MKVLKGIGIFFGTFLVYHMILSGFFPVDENNVLQVSDWYTIVGIVISALSAVFFTKRMGFSKKKPKQNGICRKENEGEAKQKEVADDMANYNLNLDDLGKNIQQIVDRAVNSQDYQKLDQTIRQTVGKAVDIGGEAVRKVISGASVLEHSVSQKQAVEQLYGKTGGKTVKSVLKVIGASVLLPIVFVLFWGAATLEYNFISLTLTLVMLAGLIGTAWLMYSGIKNMGMLQRFKIYRRLLGQKTYCSLEVLARTVDKRQDTVCRELRKMIASGLFLQGHLDREQTCLITSDETFRYYEQSRLAFEERQRLEAAKKSQKAASGLNPKVQEILDQGASFIDQIRKCNDDIPGEEISAKISHMELIVQRIFERAEADSDIVPDLKKLMDYYLPMTVKLLNAYADMDAQPVQGETIQASKREIEATLDTLNLAFEKLLDSVFKETSMDISSDISALNVLLAQEGLTEDDFSKIKKQQAD